MQQQLLHTVKYEEINGKGKFVEKREYRNSFVKFEQQNICLNRLTIDIFPRKTLEFVYRRFRNAVRL
jgi:hypothetical protein